MTLELYLLAEIISACTAIGLTAFTIMYLLTKD